MEQTIQKSVHLGDGWLTVDVHGEPDGPAIVLVPGAMADAAGWAQVAGSLRAWRTVVVVNRRGRHPSGPLPSAYSLQSEVDDLGAVLREFSDVRTLFGWSYGGLIALHLTAVQAIPQVIAYEPVMRPFGEHALAQLRRAEQQSDREATVLTVLQQISGVPDEQVQQLRADEAAWAEMRRLSAPIHAETLAINTAPRPARLGVEAGRIDLIIGERNQGRMPYGASFDDVASRVPDAPVHVLAGQGHMAHVEAPDQLAQCVDRLVRP